MPEIHSTYFKLLFSLSVLLTDDRPLIVVTHGDLLSHFDRARVRIHLGELLGIPPTKQIFDIPGNPLFIDYLSLLSSFNHT